MSRRALMTSDGRPVDRATRADWEEAARMLAVHLAAEHPQTAIALIRVHESIVTHYTYNACVANALREALAAKHPHIDIESEIAEREHRAARARAAIAAHREDVAMYDASTEASV